MNHFTGSSINFRFIALTLLVCIIISGFGLRIYKPQADPPDWNYIFNTDEGHYSYNALSKLKHGHWFPDEAKYALVTPLFSAGQYFVALLLEGQSDIVRFRAISIISGIISSLFIAFFLEGKMFRIAGVALASISFMSVVHSRLGITEMMLTLFLQLTVFFAWQGGKNSSIFFSFLAGLGAAACFMIKPTGGFILPVIIIAPLISHTLDHHMKLYWKGVGGGVLLGISLWLFVIGIPYWDEWRNMLAATISFGKESIVLSPMSVLKSISTFLFSPALQSMPLLWPLSISWCFFFFLPRFKKKQVDFLEALIFLWLFFGIGVLGFAAYQPGRWQLFLLPPIIVAGLRFLQCNPRFFVMVISLIFALALSVFYSKFFIGRFLQIGGEIHPGYGMFSNVFSGSAAVLVFFGVYFLLRRLKGLERWQSVSCSVIVLELVVQCFFHGMVTLPSYKHPSQWSNVAVDTEKLIGRDKIISGIIVQNLALYSDINVIPTFYVLKGNDDKSVEEFYSRQPRLPSYFMMDDVEYKKWRANAPNFVNNLEEARRYVLNIGGLGRRVFLIYKIKSYDWLPSREQS